MSLFPFFLIYMFINKYIYKLKLSTIRKFNLSIKKKKTSYPKTKEELSKKLALKKKGK